MSSDVFLPGPGLIISGHWIPESNKKYICRVKYRFGLEPDYTKEEAFDISNYKILHHNSPQHHCMSPPGANLQIDYSRFHPKFCNVNPQLILFKTFRKISFGNKSRPGNYLIIRKLSYCQFNSNISKLKLPSNLATRWQFFNVK